MERNTFDYIIVGAGSAGCVLANRLSANPQLSVLLLEMGGKPSGWVVDMPSAMGHALSSPFSRTFYSEPEPHLNGRRLYTPRGQGLGGTTIINGMVYLRGHPRDFDNWRDMGAAGWGYADVLPYFRRAEGSSGSQDGYRGKDGPLRTRSGAEAAHLYDRMWVQAGAQVGYPTTEDVNGYQQEGLGYFSATIHKGRRYTAYRAYLEPAMHRKNLTVVTGATARRVLFEGLRASGVEYDLGNSRHTARARREVILSGGALASPQLLMLSGIGSAQDLQNAGVPPILDLPGVGQNLIDHPDAHLSYESTRPDTLRSILRPTGQLMAGARWFALSDGPCAGNHLNVGGHVRSKPGIEWPDLQFHFLPVCYQMNADDTITFAPRHGFSAHVSLSRPLSRGRVWLGSPDPNDAPRFIYNYFDKPEDLAAMRSGLRLLREIFSAEVFNPVRGAETVPGAALTSDEAIDHHLRRFVKTEYHPAGTCRMGGNDDPLAVLDAECCVRGIDALRVVDASVMPDIPNGNLNAPTVMIAEKVSDLILGQTPLPPLEKAWWTNQNWRTSQK